MKNIKRATLVLGAMVMMLAHVAQADFSDTYTTGFQNAGVVPDGNLTGWSDTRLLSSVVGNILDVNVRLNLSGGWNGDLYAYLVHGDGFAVLLNRVGVTTTGSAGYGDPGMNVTLDDQAANNIHLYGGGGTPSNAWRPDGRNISPLTPGATLYGTDSTALLSSFSGLDPNGNWTLFLADVSGGSESTVVNWGLDIATVAEPGSVVEATLAALALGTVVRLYNVRKRKAQPVVG